MKTISIFETMTAIAEGYPTEGWDDRYVVVENPAFAEDNGNDPKLVFDTWSLRDHAPARTDPHGASFLHELHCNANRTLEIGCDGCSCRAGREIKRLRAELAHRPTASTATPAPGDAFAAGYQFAVEDLGREGDYQNKDWSEPYEFLKRSAAALSVPAKPADAPAGFYTDGNGDEWLCVEVGGNVRFASAEASSEVSRELFDKYAWTPSDRAPSVIAHDREWQGKTVSIEHDGFTGDVIGAYVTREGKRGVVVQQAGTRVVHVYGEKWLTDTTQSRNDRGGSQS